jgi:hypothetical protein
LLVSLSSWKALGILLFQVMDVQKETLVRTLLNVHDQIFAYANLMVAKNVALLLAQLMVLKFLLMEKVTELTAN